MNDTPWLISPIQPMYDDAKDSQFGYYIEQTSQTEDTHVVKFVSGDMHVNPNEAEFKVPPHSYFVMGDNRDQSHDSRFWGFVDHNLLIGQASFIWLSCEKTLETAPMICDPETLRLKRFFTEVQ